MHMIGQMWWDATWPQNCFPKLLSQAWAPPCFAPTQPRCHPNPAASPERVFCPLRLLSATPPVWAHWKVPHKKWKKHNNKKRQRWKVNLPHTFSWNIRDHVLLAFHFIPSSALGLYTSQTIGAMYPSRTAKAEKTKKLNLVVSAPERSIIPFLGIEMR